MVKLVFLYIIIEIFGNVILENIYCYKGFGVNYFFLGFLMYFVCVFDISFNSKGGIKVWIY